MGETDEDGEGETDKEGEGEKGQFCPTRLQCSDPW